MAKNVGPTQRCGAKQRGLRLGVLALCLGCSVILWLSLPLGADARWFWRAPWSGRAQQTRLLRMLARTPHKELFDEARQRDLVRWVAEGGGRDLFYGHFWPWFQRRCLRCHNGKQAHHSRVALRHYASLRPYLRMQPPLRRMFWRALLRWTPALFALLWLLGWCARSLTTNPKSKLLLLLAGACWSAALLGLWHGQYHDASLRWATVALLACAACVWGLGIALCLRPTAR